MKKALLIVILLNVCSAYGSLVYDDNLEHIINFEYESGWISVRNSTSVTVVNGADVGLRLSDNASAYFEGGKIRGLACWGVNTVYITGGDFRYQADYIFAIDTTAHIKGGLFWSYQEGIETADTNVEHNSKLIFYGTDFTYTTEGPGRYYISGTLENGDALDNFQVDLTGPDASIQFVPEPATLAILALGGVLIRRRRAA